MRLMLRMLRIQMGLLLWSIVLLRRSITTSAWRMKNRKRIRTTCWLWWRVGIFFGEDSVIHTLNNGGKNKESNHDNDAEYGN